MQLAILVLFLLLHSNLPASSLGHSVTKADRWLHVWRCSLSSVLVLGCMFKVGDRTVNRTDSKCLCCLLFLLEFLFSPINQAAVAFLTNLVDFTSYKERLHSNLAGIQDLFLGILFAWPRSLLMSLPGLGAGPPLG